MPFATFAAGPYTASFDTSEAPGSPAGKSQGRRDLGLVEGVRRWQRTAEAMPIRAGAFGQTVIDGIYCGGQCYCLMTFQEWSSAVRDAIWPFGESFAEVGSVGRLLTELAGVLTLEAATDSPAATAGPATLTFGKAILSPGHNCRITMGDKPRNVSVVFRCFPYANDQGQIVWFEES